MDARLGALLQRLDDLALDVFFAAMHLYINRSKNENGMVLVLADDVLEMRGIEPKRDPHGYRAGHRAKDRHRVANMFQILDNLWLDVCEVIYYERPESGRGRRDRGKRTRLSFQSKVLVVSARVTKRSEDEAAVPIAWLVRPGEWAQYYLDNGVRQTALLDCKVLGYDPVRRLWEKRLGVYFALQFRIRRGRPGVPYRVSTLVAAVGMTVDAGHPGRTRDRFEEALDHLVDDGVVGGWQYVDLDEEALGKRSWVDSWLQSGVLVEPPPALVEHYRTITRPRRRA